MTARNWLTAAAVFCVLWTVLYTAIRVAAATSGSP